MYIYILIYKSICQLADNINLLNVSANDATFVIVPENLWGMMLALPVVMVYEKKKRILLPIPTSLPPSLKLRKVKKAMRVKESFHLR
ncbi:MAG: hypothetical protein UR52_C0027G0005 [Candidatus Gottesmanbacteria bacterium GW2011_GWA1_34_13]|uniref:Uncharacterized protein n=1 Tax=Candidatus Gottesmanbacteria bacterium GW2011_GWA1_34_13 TaxID=1618434 RepID=A0A0G0ALB6_9BACT|nr:MAG: hypothetical protein UR52_C0027G0005 [Candidatus Gottesmanbacteria bacterium GW2011_GWA1_34_13]